MDNVKSSITDIPRDNGENDNFGIEPFERGLTEFINNSNTPITIALQGEWGSGKTSLMNSLQNNLTDLENTKSKYQSVWLNTWEYALMKDPSATLIDIITKLIEEVSKIANVGNEKKTKLIANVKKIGLSALRVASSVNRLASKGVTELENVINSEQDVTIGHIRDELEIIIREYVENKNNNKQGIIFFIDDLDRIDPPVAVQLLELLKNIFTIKNCVFILAIDYDVVIKGLESKFGKFSEKNEREFRSFFDKIIQVPFSMPVSNYNINEFLKESLKSTNYINEKQANNNELISKFSEISDLSVGKNPRALKRLMNSLSLISYINSEKKNNEDDNQLNEYIELLVNFALVSIQIAYPPVYRLLSLHSGFDKWNESVALQMNLKQLEQQSIDKLNQSEEFDEEWEKVLFRLCENDHYLKKRSLEISRLLNSLKHTIVEKGEDVENVIGDVISLSSVTNLEAFDKPVENYHKGVFLKTIREELIPRIKSGLPEIANTIQKQGRTVRSNAYIKFSEKDWGYWIKLYSNPTGGGIRLTINSDKWLTPINNKPLEDIINEVGLENDFKYLENKYDKYISKYEGFEVSKLFGDVRKYQNSYLLNINSYITLPKTETFLIEDNLIKISSVIVEMYHLLEEIELLKDKIWRFY